MQWTSGGLRVESALASGVLVLDFAGLVTPGVLTRFCREVAGADHGALCLIGVFAKAMVAVTAESFTGLHDLPEVRGRRFQAPGAIICKKIDYSMFQQSARRCAEIGVVRSVFTLDRFEQAIEWAEDRAESARLAALSRLCHSSPFRALAQ